MVRGRGVLGRAVQMTAGLILPNKTFGATPPWRPDVAGHNWRVCSEKGASTLLVIALPTVGCSWAEENRTLKVFAEMAGWSGNLIVDPGNHLILNYPQKTVAN